MTKATFLEGSHPLILAPEPTTLPWLEPIRQAVRSDRATALARTLADLVREGAFEQPDLFANATERRARRLLWREPKDGFVVLALSWPRNSSTPLHDHDGQWGAEVVVRGTMCETQFRLIERGADGRVRFAREQTNVLERSEGSTLIAPREYHEYGNAGGTIAHTIHVYGAELVRCTTFLRDDDGWWTGQPATLGYDD